MEEKYSDYLLISFEHSFLASNLLEEAILFGVTQPTYLLKEVEKLFIPFKSDFSANRPVHSLSGGERAILCVIFYCCLLRYKKAKKKILLKNIMESLSYANRTALIDLLASFKNDGITCFNLINDQIFPL